MATGLEIIGIADTALKAASWLHQLSPSAQVDQGLEEMTKAITNLHLHKDDINPNERRQYRRRYDE